MDLSKKPRMWEAFLAVPGEEEEQGGGGGEKGGKGGKGGGEEEKEKDMMSEKGKGGQGQGFKGEHVEWESIMVCSSLFLFRPVTSIYHPSTSSPHPHSSYSSFFLTESSHAPYSPSLL